MTEFEIPKLPTEEEYVLVLQKVGDAAPAGVYNPQKLSIWERRMQDGRFFVRICFLKGTPRTLPEIVRSSAMSVVEAEDRLLPGLEEAIDKGETLSDEDLKNMVLTRPGESILDGITVLGRVKEPAPISPQLLVSGQLFTPEEEEWLVRRRNSITVSGARLPVLLEERRRREHGEFSKQYDPLASYVLVHDID